MTSLLEELSLAEPATVDVFARENALLRQRNAQLEAALAAIRDGEMDALLITREGGCQLFSLAGADHIYRLMVEEMGEGAVTLTPKGVIAYANRRFAEMLGRPLQQVIGSRITGCFAPEGRQAVTALLRRGQVSKRSTEADLLTETGNRMPTLLSVRHLATDGMPDAVCMVVTDLTVQKLGEVAIETRQTLLQLVETQREATELQQEEGAVQASLLIKANEQLTVASMRAQMEAESAVEAYQEVSRRAEHDALTGLPNRILLLDRLDQSIAIAERHGSRLALLFIDLNDFKQINDTYGHGTGDEVLKLAAKRLTSSVRKADTVSRHGGDEFLILLSEVSHPSDTALIVEKVLAALGAPAKVGEHLVSLSASIGVSVYPEDGSTGEELIERADEAMYRIKRKKGQSSRVAALQEHSRSSISLLDPSPPGTALEDHEASQERLIEANRSLSSEVQSAKRLLSEAEANGQRQTDFMAVLVHELTTPFATSHAWPATASAVDPGPAK